MPNPTIGLDKRLRSDAKAGWTSTDWAEHVWPIRSGLCLTVIGKVARRESQCAAETSLDQLGYCNPPGFHTWV